ncbi:MAG: HAD hydrolase family protein [Dorea sp.]|jgi:hydroxymethylpyrimidine pyrophosphatase-like HAD family hydrolase|nr:HAD hydrolase family protein [Dorea sp.]
MRVVHLDLDNTLIYSYKHIFGAEKPDGMWMNVETYQGRKISYVTKKTQELLRYLNKKCLLVPTTTRTIQQYNRIALDAGPFDYALVCNGGILLINGESDPSWYERSRELIADCTKELRHALNLLEKEPLRKFELRFIEKLFVFTKCNDPDTVISRLKMELDTEKIDVLANGEKVYAVPKKLDKGMAVQRFGEYIGADEVVAAGDSEFDVSMVEAADIGIVPPGFCRKYQAEGNIKEMKGDSFFSDEMLSWIEAYVKL